MGGYINPLMQGLLQGAELRSSMQQMAMRQVEMQRMQRQSEIDDLKHLLEFQAYTKPVQGGMVTESSGPGPDIGGISAPSIELRRKAKGTVKYRTGTGQEYVGEPLSYAEQQQRAFDQRMTEAEAMDQQKVAEAINMRRGLLGEAGVDVPAPGGGTRRVLPTEAGGMAQMYHWLNPPPAVPSAHVIPASEGTPARVVTTAAGKVTGTEAIPGTERTRRATEHVVTDDDGNVSIVTTPALGRPTIMRVGRIGKSKGAGGDDAARAREYADLHKELAALESEENAGKGNEPPLHLLRRNLGDALQAGQYTDDRGTLINLSKNALVRKRLENKLATATERFNQIMQRKGQIMDRMKTLEGGGQRQDSGRGKGQLTDPALAQQYLQRAGGDKDKARKLAQADGWTF